MSSAPAPVLGRSRGRRRPPWGGAEAREGEGGGRDDIRPSIAWTAPGRGILDIIFGDVVFCAQDGEALVGLYGRLKHFRAWLQAQGLRIN